MNWIGCYTLWRKEIMRFGKVWLQTIGAPVLTALLNQLIFGNALGSRIGSVSQIDYHVFIVPGLVMMGMTQNAFANVSSSLIQSRISGNLVYILLPPLSAIDLFIAYTGAAVIRGLAVGGGILLCTALFVMPLPFPVHFFYTLYFALCGCLFMASLGLIVGIISEKFDQIAAFQNFLIIPLTFLSGVFYSIHMLPPFWQNLSRANPVFYLIDGFRYGFFGQSDTPPLLALGISTAFTLFFALIAYLILHSGWKLRNS